METIKFFIENILDLLVQVLGGFATYDCIIYVPFILFLVMQVVSMFKLLVGAVWGNG